MSPPTPTFVIAPSARWRALPLRELWRYRDLVGVLARREVTLRYRQTALGVIWVVLQPLTAAVIFSVVFGRVAKLPSDGVPYFLFAFSGFLGWNAFQGTLLRASASLLQNSQLVSKVYFPRLALPLSTTLLTLIDFVVGFLTLLVVMPFHGMTPGWSLVTLPLWLAGLVLLALALGMYAAALTVRYRDVQHALPVIVQFVLYASPVAYAVSAVPASIRPFFLLNPLTPLLEGLRWSITGGRAPTPGSLLYCAAVILVLLLAGAFEFRRLEREFADVI